MQPIPPFGGWEEAFVKSPGFSPAGADEAAMWQAYKDAKQRLLIPRQSVLDTATILVTRAGVLFPRVRLQDDRQIAVPFLALRAARRAIAADPNHPDGYFALYRAFNDPNLPVSEQERALGQITSLRQCLERMPPPEEFRPSVYLSSPTQVAVILAELYLGRRQETGNVVPGVLLGNAPAFWMLRDMGAASAVMMGKSGPVRVPAASQQGLMPPPYYLLSLDLAREAFQKAEKYAVVEVSDAKTLETVLTEIKNEMKLFESELARNNNTFESRRGQRPLREQIPMALQLNLGNEALRMLTPTEPDFFSKEFGPAALEFMLCRISLELAQGRLEDAAGDLERLSKADGLGQRLGNPMVRVVYHSLMYQKCLLEGNYAEAEKIMDELDGPGINNDPSKLGREKFNPKPFVESKESLAGWANFAPLSGIASPTLLDLVTRSSTPLAALAGYEYQRSPTEIISLPGFWTLQNQLIGFRNARAEVFYRRGLLMLFEGDNVAARKLFQQTRQPAVPDWGLPDLRHPEAELYLRLMDEAEKKTPPK